MKVHHRELTKNKSGKIVLTAEEPEDLWHVYNMLQAGDRVEASTVRNVKKESSTGLRTTERKHFKLTIKIETLDFDQTVCCLSMKGTNTEQNEFVNIGQYHTIDLELGRRFTIYKDEWDSITLRRIKEATDMNLKAEVGAVVMEEGLAHVCLVLSALTVVKQKIQTSIQGKRRPDKHEESMKKFFKNVATAMKTNFDFDRLKCIIIASPGFVREEFMEYMFIQNEENKKFIEHRAKFVSCRSSSGYKHSLMEVLQDPGVARRLEDTKAAKETKAFETFQQTLLDDGDRAFYGTKQVEKACELQAIDTLLMTDSLFRCFDVNRRRRYVKLSERAQAAGANVYILSSLHPSGIQLANLTGIAAILRFPLPDIEDIDFSDDE